MSHTIRAGRSDTPVPIPPGAVAPTPTEAAAVAHARRRRGVRRRAVVCALALAIVGAFITSLMVGHTFYGLDQVWQVILGNEVDGATFTVGTLRLPRAALAVLAGAAFGIAGVTFQTMLRNPLASPDIIGISSGASAAAVFAIVVLKLPSAGVSAVAVVGGLVVAIAVYLLSYKAGVAGTRLILIGIGVAAMLDSVVAYLLERAGQWDYLAALRWLAGSLNGASWNSIVPLAIALVLLVPVLLGQSRNLGMLQMGDDAAAALGVRVEVTRIVLVVGAVALIAIATSAAGPVAFVAFLSGPIAARLVGPSGSLLVPSALVGALLVLVADLVGQWLLGTRYPVGVVTGVLGAPFLLYLIARINRKGGAL